MTTKKLGLKFSKELLPSRLAERTVGMAGYFSMWVGMAVIIATYSLGGLGVAQISLPWVAFACLLANLITGFFITLSGDIGLEHGIPFPLYLRVVFGPVGSAIPSLIRALLACVWTGIQTYFGAIAISYIVKYFTGFDNWMVCFVIFMAAQIINAAMGIDAIDKFAWIAAPSIIVISLYLIYKIMNDTAARGIDVWNSIAVPGADVMLSTGGVSMSVFFMVLFTNMSYWSTNAADTQSLTKYVKAPLGEKNWLKRNKNAIVAHMIALPLTQTFCVLIGGMAMLGFGDWNPINALQSSASGVFLIVLLLLVVFAQWSTNTAASILPGAMTFMNISGGRLNYHMAVVLVGVIATVAQPWLIMERFGGFLGYMGSVYGPIAGIFLVDYYILRKRRLNVPELYKADGQFAGSAGWNFAGIIALVVGVIIGNFFGAAAFPVGLAAGFVAYFFLAKYWWYKIHKQSEIEENYPDKYLGITASHEWVINEKEIEI